MLSLVFRSQKVDHKEIEIRVIFTRAWELCVCVCVCVSDGEKILHGYSMQWIGGIAFSVL
jgi:hypothetical protein